MSDCGLRARPLTWQRGQPNANFPRRLQLLPNPLHPALVHFPIVLMVLLPVSAVVALWAIRRGAQPTRAWLVAVGLLQSQAGSAARVVTVFAAAGLMVAGYQVGHSGGELGYRHGAASAYVGQAGTVGGDSPAEHGSGTRTLPACSSGRSGPPTRSAGRFEPGPLVAAPSQSYRSVGRPWTVSNAQAPIAMGECMSTKPGVTNRPRRSTTRVPRGIGVVARSPTASIHPFQARMTASGRQGQCGAFTHSAAAR